MCKLRGGAENGEFAYIGQVEEDVVVYQSGKLNEGELLLEVENLSISGLPLYDIHTVIKNCKGPVRLKTVRQEKRPSPPVFCGEDLLQVDHEELQVADIINKKKFTTELQAEKNNKQQADTLRTDLGKELEQKKPLQTTYEELQEAQKLNQEEFSAELDTEKEKNKILKQDLDKIHTSHCKISQRCETDVIMVIQQADTLQHEIHNLRITILQQNAFE
ncbi:Membrane-associated guanylate kinase [Nibea albiflora]|uniref:Membrane-associated guanylate kinase n=1 Tax=Nibea albiflora TaxID=240163 RepID=A0ACB7F343_NIBAL|nr:Membrane-associated guanylate kinase [Nibea albiflora]